MANSRDMVRQMRERYSFNSPKVFSAMLRIPREKFVPPEYQHQAYDDCPISIGYGQTISQPYTVAFMTDLLKLKGSEKVLEIGTGSGYQAAILSLLADKVYTVEIIRQLADQAKERLKRLGYKKVEVKTASGEVGWKQKAPFDAILVTAGMEKVPEALFKQLKEGGVLVAPVGLGMDKEMTEFSKHHGKISQKSYGIFHFVPFVEKN